jgi:hypothetical protein
LSFETSGLPLAYVVVPCPYNRPVMPSSAAQSAKTRGLDAGSVAVKPGVEWAEESYVYVQICLW